MELSTSALEVRLPLSTAQRGIWFHLRTEPSRAPQYQVRSTVVIDGPIDTLLLERSIKHVVSTTTALRMCIRYTGEFFQELNSTHDHELLQVIDFSDRPDPDQQAAMWIKQQLAKIISLSDPQYYRYALIKLGANRFYLHCRYHHAVVDGIGSILLVGLLAATYTRLEQGKSLADSNDLEEYRNYILDEAAYKESPQYDVDRRFWLKAGAGEPTTLSIRNRRPAVDVPAESKTLRTFNSALFVYLSQTSEQLKVNRAQLMIAAAALYLHRVLDSPQITIGLPTHGRTAVRSLVAMCADVLPLNLSIAHAISVRDGIASILEQLRVALHHRRFRSEDILKSLGAKNASAADLHQILINVLPFPEEMHFGTAKSFLREATPYVHSLTIWIFVGASGEKLAVKFSGNASLYESWELDSHLDAFAHLLNEMSLGGERQIGRIPLLNDEIAQRMLVRWNATSVDYSAGKCIHELFEEKVRKARHEVAVKYEDRQLTYEELNKKANQLAHYLREKGVRPDELVGVCVDRSLEMIVGLLGILKAGGAYVPLDPSYPQERLAYMLKDAAPKIVLTQERLRGQIPATYATVVALDGECDGIAKCADDNIDAALLGLTPQHLAYVIYTSGSTGLPKGVMNTHRGVCNLATAQIAALDVQSRSRVLQFASFSFDASVSEIMMSLCAGAKLVLACPANLMPGKELLKTLSEETITHVTLPPSALAVMTPTEQLDSLSTLIVAGETCPVGLLQRWGVDRSFFNAYGPTESAVCASMHLCDASLDAIPPIGRPIANVQIYILDASRMPVPIGVVGEIYIGGVGVARGYLNRPELTAERFVSDPFSQESLARMYKTGDLGRYLPDGNIDYVGRSDHQVKIRGFRIELGEIESQLNRHPVVREAVVVVREDGPGEKRLVAYYTLRTGEVSAAELRSHTSERLPQYMIPSAFVQLESLPLTPNGKVDRRALPSPELDGYAVQAYEAPRGEIEQALADTWQELLQIERVGRYDNFFELGGHSLMAIQIMIRINDLFNVKVSVEELFLAPQLCKFSDVVVASRGSNPANSAAESRQ